MLRCRLVFFDIVHELPYEGPCRFGKGPELEREFGEMIVEFAQMVKKPIIFVGNDYGATINTSAMLARCGRPATFARA